MANTWDIVKVFMHELQKAMPEAGVTGYQPADHLAYHITMTMDDQSYTIALSQIALNGSPDGVAGYLEGIAKQFKEVYDKYQWQQWKSDLSWWVDKPTTYANYMGGFVPKAKKTKWVPKDMLELYSGPKRCPKKMAEKKAKKANIADLLEEMQQITQGYASNNLGGASQYPAPGTKAAKKKKLASTKGALKTAATKDPNDIGI